MSENCRYPSTEKNYNRSDTLRRSGVHLSASRPYFSTKALSFLMLISFLVAASIQLLTTDDLLEPLLEKRVHTSAAEEEFWGSNSRYRGRMKHVEPSGQNSSQPFFDFPLTAFVLAGGRSSRMGRDKALLKLGDGYLIDYPIRVLRQVTQDVRIIGDPRKYGFLDFPVIPDCVESRGPISGIYSALRASPSLFSLIMGCDMPKICSSFIRLLMTKASLGDAVMMKFDDGLIEPLCSLYSKACLTAIEENFRRQQYKISDVFGSVTVTYISEAEICRLGLSREIFTNVNTWEDWERLQTENPR
jgi:molybdopterin-guanine dinucleotide biosynthesis protein A